MEPSALGTLQYWGLAPPLLVDPDTEHGATLFLENSDLRYFLKNLPRLQGNVIFHERDGAYIARILVKLAMLLRIKLAKQLGDKIQVAQCYSELHGNTRISEASVAMLKTAAGDCRGLFSPKQATEVTDRLQRLVCLDYLKSTQKDEIFDHLGYFCGVSRASAKPSQDIAESFDRRLRDLYNTPYDARHRVCLWAYHFDLAPKLPFIHEIFYASFRTEGVAYLRAYFRMPEMIGGKDRLKAVGRRAPSEAESRMYCGSNNLFMGKQFTGEVLLGPWMETGFDWMLHGYETREIEQLTGKASVTAAGEDYDSVEPVKTHIFEKDVAAICEEMYRSFSPTGPESFEPILTCVELQVINLILAAEALSEFQGAIGLTYGDFQQIYKRTTFSAMFSTVFCSIEGVRFIECQEMRSATGSRARIICELAYYIPEYKQRDEFYYRMLGLLKDSRAVSCGHGFSSQLKFDGKPYEMYNTHVLGFLK